MIKMIQKLKNKKGFTLVELIVVIAIIAILTAVIVPLIARYSAQAQYTTLMDAAQTISNSTNNALSDANQIGVVSIKSITGSKSGGGALSLTPDTGAAVSADPRPTGTEAYSTTANVRALQKLWESLNSTLPADCTFYIEIKSSAVAGVVYATDKAVTCGAGTTASEVKGFDNAFDNGSGVALGVAGNKKPTTGGGSAT